MGNKYNFTDGYNKGIKDQAPDWMENFFNNKIEKKDPIIVNDLYGNSQKKVNTCLKCGKILINNKSNICNSCKNI